MAKTATGLKSETAGALCYLLWPVTGVLFLILEKDKFVRFHAMQSIVTVVGLFVIVFALGATLILAFLIPLVVITGFVLWLLLMYKAMQGQMWEVPFFGKIAKQLLPKV